MEDLLSSQKVISEQITKLNSNYKKDSASRKTLIYLKIRVENLQKLWNEFETNDRSLESLASDKEKLERSYFNTNTRDKLFEKYMEYLQEFEEKIETLTANSNNTSTGSNANYSQQLPSVAFKTETNLPRIQIPRFSGDYHKWVSFHDLFKCLIHDNQAIAPVQKLHYLKSYLDGEAEALIRHFAITDANYAAAYQALIDRFDNKRTLLNAQFKILLNLTKIHSDTAEHIKRLLDTTSECLASIQNLGYKTDNWDPFIVYLTTQKLPIETHQLWEQGLSNQEIPTFASLKIFLENRFRTLEAIKGNVRPTKIMQDSKNSKSHCFHTSNHINSTQCSICKGSHSIRTCSIFQKLSVYDRIKRSREKGLCINCLSKNHYTSKCPSKSRCFECQAKHHSLLHIYNNRQNNTGPLAHTKSQSDNKPDTQVNPIQRTYKSGNQSESNGVSGTEAIPSSSTGAINAFYVDKTNLNNTNLSILATALVNTYSKDKQFTTLRALIDPGSESNFITKRAAKILNLKAQPTNVRISGLAATNIGTAAESVQFTIQSCINSSHSYLVEAYIMPSLTDWLPEQPINPNIFKHLDGLTLADHTFHQPGRIDLLLGVGIHARIIEEGIRKGVIDEPIAQKSSLGWLVSGPTKCKISRQALNTHLVSSSDIPMHKIDELLQKFWKLEEIIDVSNNMSPEESLCENLYSKTTKRLPDGRYIVALPFKPNYSALGKSREIAVSRFFQLERKFKADPAFHLQYTNCFNDYLSSGHMELIKPTTDRNSNQISNHMGHAIAYLPHHAVMKESSTTTKLRIVFDASRKTSSGTSLNDTLLVGPTIQLDLTTIILKWRMHRCVITADITKMYRQVKVTPESSDYQRIIWRSTDTDSLSYRLKTVTFGTACAPFLAVRTIEQLAQRLNFPLASNSIKDFYVDDLLTGADNLSDTIELQKQFMGLLKAGGFQLSKWASNHTEILADMPKEHVEMKTCLGIADDDTIKTLGIYWQPNTDDFIFKISPPSGDTGICTKRTILSEASRLFDPLGWVSPIVIFAKILMQKLWIAGVSWDEKLPYEIVKDWEEYKDNLYKIETIKLPRWTHFGHDISLHELHGFCDASNHAYAAVVYYRIIDQRGKIHVSLLAAKTRVAPIKQVSIPRLELCGAVLLTRLIKTINNHLKIPACNIFTWCDSTIVLSWLRAYPGKWTTFVANRVSEVQQNSYINHWGYVSTKENPADCASRGTLPQHIINHSLWWAGPSWLHESQENWPSLSATDLAQTEIEIKKPKKAVLMVQLNTGNIDILSRFSSYNKLIRVVAYLKKFVDRCKKIDTQKEEGFTTSELNSALSVCITWAQNEEFAEEIQALTQGKNIDKGSHLRSLNPFIDKCDILRVGGRLESASMQFEEKHPIILSAKNHLSVLLIRKIHIETLHGGPQLMSNILRRKYWILNARNLTKTIVNRCMIFARQKAETRIQLMGNLPPPRVNQSRPFLHSGVDYAGPIELKTYKGRSSKFYKGYIAIFVCLAVKAIHIELVTDLTSEAFLAAFRRFTARRGTCTDLYSDNGTNFVGANSILTRQAAQNLRTTQNEHRHLLANEGVTWHFIPPSSPHFGGLWEAGVKSIKYHLRRVTYNSKLTYEELNTTLVQIEACLNSRPLSPLSNNINDESVLTPGHFLIGDIIKGMPEISLLEKNVNCLKRWQYVQLLYQSFWRRWQQEYLSRMQQRPKWMTKVGNFKVGDLVILKERDASPLKWPLARIIEVHTGKDGLVRVVTLRTKQQILKRAITKICQLPIQATD